MTDAGTEVDWLRQLWDVRTGGTATVSMTGIINWINVSSWNSIAWNFKNAYTILDGRANTVGGQLNTNWDAHKGNAAGIGNGINH